MESGRIQINKRRLDPDYLSYTPYIPLEYDWSFPATPLFSPQIVLSIMVLE